MHVQPLPRRFKRKMQVLEHIRQIFTCDLGDIGAVCSNVLEAHPHTSLQIYDLLRLLLKLVAFAHQAVGGLLELLFLLWVELLLGRRPALVFLRGLAFLLVLEMTVLTWACCREEPAHVFCVGAFIVVEYVMSFEVFDFITSSSLAL